ncbi:hypothetical protein AS888_07945 [Peribacillus simplex]|uniref:Uncharacterized protein n=1 Tax=Peribacillus simplex TaxID=1478 RepID=A0A120GNE7_9BACI|nr:hypothetical protein AS888_07945 [Peribacillus simplex]
MPDPCFVQKSINRQTRGKMRRFRRKIAKFVKKCVEFAEKSPNSQIKASVSWINFHFPRKKAAELRQLATIIPLHSSKII